MKITIRAATTGKTMRIRWEDGSPIDVGSSARGEAKSQVAIAHRKLASKGDADHLRTFWSERLETLAAMMKQ